MLPNFRSDILTENLLDFLPELVLCFAIVLMLFLRLFRGFNRTHLGGLALVFTLLSLAVSVLQWLGPQQMRSLGLDLIRLEAPRVESTPIFGGMLVYDALTGYVRLFLYSFTALVIWLTLLTGIPDREDSADFYVLLLGSVLGMSLMASAVHLLMVFIAIEMASLPSYAMAGFLKGRRQSSEAALKYVVYGGGAAGIMLFGISLLSGICGTGYLPDVTFRIVDTFKAGVAGSSSYPIIVMGVLFLLIGIAFKLSLVPFHFWCPDVFEGASAEVAGFLSVASKGAALALLARFTLMIGGLDPLVGGRQASVAGLPYMDIIRYLVPALGFFAALTATFGNLAAYMQTNLKRLLAYSTIAHAGYMVMGLCTLTRAGLEATIFYMVAYLFMNLGAFAVIAFLRNQTHSEDLADFRGLIRRSPVMVLTLSVFLLSLLGMPPLIGFAAKFQIFAILWSDGQAYYKAGETGIGATLIGLLVVGGINTVLSAFYYLKVLKVMILDRRTEDLEGTVPPPLAEPIGTVIYSMLLALSVLVLGILWGPLGEVSSQGVARYRLQPGKDANQDIPPDGPVAPKGPGGAKGPGGKGGGGGFKGPGGGKGGGFKGGGKGKGAPPPKGPVGEAGKRQPELLPLPRVAGGE